MRGWRLVRGDRPTRAPRRPPRSPQRRRARSRWWRRSRPVLRRTRPSHARRRRRPRCTRTCTTERSRRVRWPRARCAREPGAHSPEPAAHGTARLCQLVDAARSSSSWAWRPMISSRRSRSDSATSGVGSSAIGPPGIGWPGIGRMVAVGPSEGPRFSASSRPGSWSTPAPRPRRHSARARTALRGSRRPRRAGRGRASRPVAVRSPSAALRGRNGGTTSA